jgi:hypothetical protein
MVHRIPGIDRAAADWASAGLRFQKALAVLEGRAVGIGHGSDPGSVGLAEDTAFAGRVAAAHALTQNPPGQPLVRLVEEQPFSMLSRFAPSGRKRRRSLGRELDAVRLAVAADPGLILLSRHAWPTALLLLHYGPPNREGATDYCQL